MSRHKEEARQGEFSGREKYVWRQEMLVMLEEMIEVQGGRNMIIEENHGRCHEINRMDYTGHCRTC